VFVKKDLHSSLSAANFTIPRGVVNEKAKVLVLSPMFAPYAISSIAATERELIGSVSY
jgi:hypothetical protein